MKKFTLSHSGGIALTSFFGLVVLVAGYFLITSMAGQEQELVESYRARMQTLQKREIEITARLESLRLESTSEDSNIAFFAFTDPAETSSRLQTTIRQIVADSGGTLETSQVLPNNQIEAVPKLSLSMRGRIDEIGLLTMLEKFSNHRPILAIDSFDVQVVPGNADHRPLVFSATISGFSHDAS